MQINLIFVFALQKACHKDNQHQHQHEQVVYPDMSNSYDSLECLDRQLLRQLNEQDLDAIDTVFKLDSHSRPISLLSVNSYDTSSTSTSASLSATTFTNTEQTEPASVSPNENNNIKSSFEQISSELNLAPPSDRHQHQANVYNLTFRQKLEDLKASTDQMVFRQSHKHMESLHKTLESFLNLDQSSKMTMMMKPIKSTVLVAANDLQTNCLPNNNNNSNNNNPAQADSDKRGVSLANRVSMSFNGATASYSQQRAMVASPDKAEATRVSRILSPARFRPAPQIIQHIQQQQQHLKPVDIEAKQIASSPSQYSSPTGSSLSTVSSNSSSSSSSSSSPSISSSESPASSYVPLFMTPPNTNNSSVRLG